MKNKNGFIATSVLYAFLLAFLTLFLAYTGNYLQNKLLLDRVSSTAEENLESYGNTRISDMVVGDYVVFDTINSRYETDEYGNLNYLYMTPLSPNSRWILFYIDENKPISNDECKSGSHLSTYYFISDISAQIINYSLYNAVPDYSGGNPVYSTSSNDSITPGFHDATIQNITRQIKGNLYYNTSNSKWYSISDSASSELINSMGGSNLRKYYSYALGYSYGDLKPEVSIFSTSDFEKIMEIDDDDILDSIFGQDSDYLIWNDSTSGTNLDKIGYYVMSKKMFTSSVSSTEVAYGGDAESVNSSCGNGAIQKNDDGTITVSNTSSYVRYSHKMNNEAIDYCFSTEDSTGETNYMTTCLDDGDSHVLSWIAAKLGLSSDKNLCTDNTGINNLRFIVKIQVDECDLENTSGYADSGNGTYQLPYLVTKGVK